MAQVVVAAWIVAVVFVFVRGLPRSWFVLAAVLWPEFGLGCLLGLLFGPVGRRR